MSTHNICFSGEIRKISAFFGRKKRSICCYDIIFTLNVQTGRPLQTVWAQIKLLGLHCLPFCHKILHSSSSCQIVLSKF